MPSVCQGDRPPPPPPRNCPNANQFSPFMAQFGFGSIIALMTSYDPKRGKNEKIAIELLIFIVQEAATYMYQNDRIRIDCIYLLHNMQILIV